MSFIETPRFPEKISEGSSGGPMWDTKITISGSGYEQRDQRWADAMHKYNAAFGIRDMQDLDDLKAFFMAMRGMVHTFRYKDWADYKSCAVEDTPRWSDQVIGTGDALGTVAFQLIKNYTQGLNYARPIKKPVDGTVVIGVDGAEVTTGWVVDPTTGVVTFAVAPPDGHIVSAGYEFDTPCRFGSDQLSTQLEVYNIGSATVPVTEVRL